MADRSPTINTGRGPEPTGYEPTTPITVSPILDWPPRPVATLRYLLTPVMLPYGMFWIALAVVTWNYLTPSMERMTTLHPRWMLEVYLRNVVLLTLVAGSLHLFLYTRRAQQQRYKYNQRWLSTTNRFVPVDQPDARQHVLVPHQRLLDLDCVRITHTVGLRQRLDSGSAVGLGVAVPRGAHRGCVPVGRHPLLFQPSASACPLVLRPCPPPASPQREHRAVEWYFYAPA